MYCAVHLFMVCGDRLRCVALCLVMQAAAQVEHPKAHAALTLWCADSPVYQRCWQSYCARCTPDHQVFKSSASSDSELLQCLNLSCDHKKVTRFLVIRGRVKMQLCIRMLLCVFSLAYVHYQHDATVADVDCL